jgi:hypothetical protein
MAEERKKREEGSGESSYYSDSEDEAPRRDGMFSHELYKRKESSYQHQRCGHRLPRFTVLNLNQRPLPRLLRGRLPHQRVGMTRTLDGSRCHKPQPEMTPTPADRQCQKRQQATTLMPSVKPCQDLPQSHIDQHNHHRLALDRVGIKQVVMKLMLVVQLYHSHNHSTLPHRL